MAVLEALVIAVALAVGCSLAILSCITQEAQAKISKLDRKLKKLQNPASLPAEVLLLRETALSYLECAEDALADRRWWYALKQAGKGLAAAAKAKRRLDSILANAGNGSPEPGESAGRQLETGGDPKNKKLTAKRGMTRKGKVR